MVVQKEIDLKALQSVVEDAMEEAIDDCEEVKINLIVANDIITVIKEASKIETQTNKRLLGCYGYYDENKKPTCFGKEYNENNINCKKCLYTFGCFIKSPKNEEKEQ